MPELDTLMRVVAPNDGGGVAVWVAVSVAVAVGVLVGVAVAVAVGVAVGGAATNNGRANSSG